MRKKKEGSKIDVPHTTTSKKNSLQMHSNIATLGEVGLVCVCVDVTASISIE